MKLRLAWVPFLLSAACSAEQDFGFASSPTPPPPGAQDQPPADTPPVGGAGAQADDGTLAEWHWLNPPRGPSALRGVASVGGATWIGGDDGDVLRWDGAQMTSVRHGTSDETLYAVWASAPNDVWFGGTRGNDGILLHYDGAAFAPIDFGGGVPVSIWGAAPNDVWAVVEASGDARIVHWNGTAWSGPTRMVGLSGPVRVRDIWGIDASHVFAVGDEGLVLRLGTDADGTPAFTRETSAASANPFDPGLHYFGVWGPSGPAFAYEGRMWAAFVATDGFGLSVVDVGTEPSVKEWRVLQRGIDLSGSTAWQHKPGETSYCATDILAARLANAPRRRGHLFNGSSFSGQSGASSPGVLSTALLDSSTSSCGDTAYAVWTVGAYNQQFPPDVLSIGGMWPSYANATVAPPDSSVFGIGFDGMQIIGVGSGGAFLQTPSMDRGIPNNAPLLAPAEPGVLDAELTAVAPVSADEAWGASRPVWNAGSSAPLLHFRYGFWGTVPGIRGDILSVATSGDTVWAAGMTSRSVSNGMSGASAFIVRGNGDTFEQRVVNDCDYLTSIVGVGPDEAWAVGLGAPYDWTLPGLCIVHVTANGAERVPTPDAFVATLVNFQIPQGTEDWERYVSSTRVAAAGPKEVYIFVDGSQMGFGAYQNMTKKLNAVLRWDGASFQQILDAPDLIAEEHYGAAAPPLLVRGPNDVLLGAGGVLHYDGARWAPLAIPGSMPDGLVALDPRQTLAVFPVDAESEVRTLKNGQWTVGIRAPLHMNAVGRAPDGSVWMVGKGGATARARRAAPIAR
jgi:hypothetical protein